MRTKVVMDGIFEVTDDGQVYRIKNGVRRLAKQSSTGRRYKYKVVTYYKDGEQKRAYVHRLIAEAFCPNPENKPEVNHIDGNPENNKAENLEWCTRSENARHAYSIGLINPYINAVTCKRCGELTNADDGICTRCKQELKSEARKIDNVVERKEEVAGIDPAKLSSKETRCIELRAQGMTYEEIARVTGTTRQNVGLHILRAYQKNSRPKKISKTTQNKLLALTLRKEKKEAKLRQLNELAYILKDEIDSINEEIALLGTPLWASKAQPEKLVDAK